MNPSRGAHPGPLFRCMLPDSAERFYAAAMAGGARTGNGLVLAECLWKHLRRPYY
jgi:hypothetical protein